MTRKEQQRINGGNPARKCLIHEQCRFGECCEGGTCMPSQYPLCGPILE
ncbi:hypothetical protein [Chryseobacterium sp. BLS98]